MEVIAPPRSQILDSRKWNEKRSGDFTVRYTGVPGLLFFEHIFLKDDEEESHRLNLTLLFVTVGISWATKMYDRHWSKGYKNGPV